MTVTIEENFSLKHLTTFKIGGPARYFCLAKSVQDVKEAVAFAKKKGLNFFVLGAGSNVLVSDGGIDGLVIKNFIRGVEFNKTDDGFISASAGAGEDWDNFVKKTVESGLWGLENLSGIPGSVGASPVQNVGAYGVEAGELIGWVEIFDSETMNVRVLSAAQCRFGYRDSIFKKPAGAGYIVTRVVFNLKSAGQPNIGYKDLAEYFKKTGASDPNLSEIRRAVLSIRAGKFPDLEKFGTAGSFFKNIIVSSAVFDEFSRKFPNLPFFPAGNGKVKIPLAWILENVCSLKGYRFGNAGLYEKQPLVVVNHGGASSGEVRRLAGFVIEKVKEKTGLEIEREVVYFG